jgi:hypothetical protein
MIKTASKPHNIIKQMENRRVSEMNNKNRQKYYDRKHRSEPPDTLQITGITNKTGTNEIAYMHIVTKSDDASYMVLALPDRRTTESWKIRGRQPKPSDPGNFDNRTLLIDLKTLVANDISENAIVELKLHSYEHRHNCNQHARNVDETSTDGADGDNDQTDDDEDNDNNSNDDDDSLPSSSSSDTSTSDGMQSRLSHLLTEQDSIPVQIMMRGKQSIGTTTRQTTSTDDDTTQIQSRKRKNIAQDQQPTSTSTTARVGYGLRSVFTSISRSITKIRKQTR